MNKNYFQIHVINFSLMTGKEEYTPTYNVMDYSTHN